MFEHGAITSLAQVDNAARPGDSLKAAAAGVGGLRMVSELVAGRYRESGSIRYQW